MARLRMLKLRSIVRTGVGNSDEAIRLNARYSDWRSDEKAVANSRLTPRFRPAQRGFRQLMRLATRKTNRARVCGEQWQVALNLYSMSPDEKVGQSPVRWPPEPRYPQRPYQRETAPKRGIGVCKRQRRPWLTPRRNQSLAVKAGHGHVSAYSTSFYEEAGSMTASSMASLAHSHQIWLWLKDIEKGSRSPRSRDIATRHRHISSSRRTRTRDATNRRERIGLLAFRQAFSMIMLPLGCARKVTRWPGPIPTISRTGLSGIGPCLARHCGLPCSPESIPHRNMVIPRQFGQSRRWLIAS